MKASRILLLMFLSCSGVVQAQQLSLFENVETEARQQETRNISPAAEVVLGAPAFTLRSASRFGDEYRSVLVNSSGESVEVNWTAGQQAVVPQSAGFTVLEVQSGKLTLRHPSNVRCVEAPSVGVSCTNATTSILSLATTAPIKLSEPVQNQGEPEVIGFDDAGQAFGRGINPFSGEGEVGPQFSEANAGTRVERARARAERLSQFEPTRIEEQDVPPGMRVVRTPFGDRLVPERQ